MKNEVVLNVEEVSQKISDAQLNCANSGSAKSDSHLIAAKELANMFGAWREGD